MQFAGLTRLEPFTAVRGYGKSDVCTVPVVLSFHYKQSTKHEANHRLLGPMIVGTLMGDNLIIITD